jgi:hypothetical protein
MGCGAEELSSVGGGLGRTTEGLLERPDLGEQGFLSRVSHPRRPCQLRGKGGDYEAATIIPKETLDGPFVSDRVSTGQSAVNKEIKDLRAFPSQEAYQRTVHQGRD